MRDEFAKCEIKTSVFSGRKPPAGNYCTIIAIAVLENVLHVAAIVVVSVAEHMDIAELGMDDVVQGQGDSLNLDPAIRKLFRDVAPAELQRRERLRGARRAGDGFRAGRCGLGALDPL